MTTLTQSNPQWVSTVFDGASQMNNDAFMTYLLFTELKKQTQDESLLSIFWVNLMLAHRDEIAPMWSRHGVYCYPAGYGNVVLTTPLLEVKIGTSFNINLDCKGVCPAIIKEGLLPILKTIIGYGIISVDTTGDSTRNYLSIGEGNISLRDAFSSAMPKDEIPPVEKKVTVASPVKKHTAIKDCNNIPLRGTYGWKKSYAELRDILDDYILDAGDVAVLPVINADILDYLKLEGGTYIDQLTEVQVTYIERDVIVCTDLWKIVLSSKHRNGRYTVYSAVASTEATNVQDVQELAKVLHALNNLYKKYKKASV